MPLERNLALTGLKIPRYEIRTYKYLRNYVKKWWAPTYKRNNQIFSSLFFFNIYFQIIEVQLINLTKRVIFSCTQIHTIASTRCAVFQWRQPAIVSVPFLVFLIVLFLLYRSCSFIVSYSKRKILRYRKELITIFLNYYIDDISNIPLISNTLKFTVLYLLHHKTFSFKNMLL